MKLSVFFSFVYFLMISQVVFSAEKVYTMKKNIAPVAVVSNTANKEKIEKKIENNVLENDKLISYLNLSDTIEQILPTVVTLNVAKNTGYSSDYYDDNFSNVISLGSGFIISEDGYIITNNHVIDGAEKINIRLKGSEADFLAEIIGVDEVMDIALLKINIKNKLPYVKFEELQNQKIGDAIIVAGNPYNLGISVSTGIVSGLNRNLQMTSFDNFIQTDAAINKGNSGGPMFNINGRVIGLTSAIYSPDGENTGIGFAMPVSDLLPIIEELKKYGYVRRGWIGLTTENTQKEVFDVLNSSAKRGVIITNVIKNSPADKSGLRISDIILSYNEKKVRSSREISSMISSTEIGSIVPIRVLRDNKLLDIKVKIDETKENYKYDSQYEALLSKAIEVFDMVLIPINKDFRKKFNISEDTEGMYVLKIKKSGLADKKGIKVGDIILSINQDSAIDRNIIIENIHRAKISKLNYIFLITKGSKNSLIFMPIKEIKLSNTNS